MALSVRAEVALPRAARAGEPAQLLFTGPHITDEALAADGQPDGRRRVRHVIVTIFARLCVPAELLT